MKASIIIPSYNSCERLYYNLLSLSVQKTDKNNFEVIVVDNGSKDKTDEAISAFTSAMNLKKIKISRNNSRGKARNLGIQEAAGEIIIFSDSDMISNQNYVEEHIAEHNTKNKVVCGTNWDKVYTYYYKDFKGRMLKNFIELQARHGLRYDIENLKDKQCLIDEESILSGTYRKYVFTHALQEYSCKRVIDIYGSELCKYNFPWRFFITNNCSVRQENIIEAGMFDEGYEGWGCEDLDLGYKLYKKGCTFVKKNIQSVHQEHPIKPGDNGIKNIYKFTEKFDSAEILLFYFNQFTTIDKSSINNIIRESNIIEKMPELSSLTSIFKDMLKIIRDKELKMFTDNSKLLYRIKETKEYINRNKKNINAACKAIEVKYGCSALSAAINRLSVSLFKINIYDNSL